ncbi:MAG: ABC transporter permease subunit [Halodesulfurarchaeum sp.]
MAELMRFEARRRVRGTLVLTLGIGAFVFMIVTIFPSIEAASGSFESLIQAYPEPMREAFAIESMTTLEGFLATEVYQFVWLLMLGLYMIYLAGGLVAGDVESGRIDLLLAAPISRKRVLVEKYLSLLIPILALNILVPFIVLLAAAWIGKSLSIVDLAVLHLFSVPYLLLAAAIGLALSVLFSRAEIAKRGGLALLFMLYLAETVTGGTEFEWVGALSPTRYFSPADILVSGTYDTEGAIIMLVAAFALVVLSGEWFARADV